MILAAACVMCVALGSGASAAECRDNAGIRHPVIAPVRGKEKADRPAALKAGRNRGDEARRDQKAQREAKFRELLAHERILRERMNDLDKKYVRGSRMHRLTQERLDKLQEPKAKMLAKHPELRHLKLRAPKGGEIPRQ